MPRWLSFNEFLADAARAETDIARQALVDELLAERPAWPWVDGERATFIYLGADAQRVALNLDTIPGDPPFAPMERLPGTNLWHVTRQFARDDLLDYMLAVDDPMTPLATDRDIVNRVARHWRKDPLNPLQMQTAQMNVSVLRMSEARPFPDWTEFRRVPRGRLVDHRLDSRELPSSGRHVWVHLPPGYDNTLVYPLLIMHDGQWAAGPLQVPAISDTLIKHGRMQPTIIAMIQSGTQEERNREYALNDRHYAFLLTELLPFLQTQYPIDSTRVAVAGVAIGGAAAAHAALKNPTVFNRLMLISPPLGKGPDGEKLRELVNRFEEAEELPARIFQSVGRYEAKGRFYRPALALRDVLQTRADTRYRFVETGSGHGLVGFKSVMPEALSWIFPGAADA